MAIILDAASFLIFGKMSVMVPDMKKQRASKSVAVSPPSFGRSGWSNALLQFRSEAERDCSRPWPAVASSGDLKACGSAGRLKGP
jgi:hypothetical protein